jgi:hypothetical protein
MAVRKAPSILTLFGLAGATAAAYALAVRPRMLRWGAVDDELLQTFPGDDLVPNARIDATHAVTIHATPARIWPWLVQIGQGRGGFYTYDWIENIAGLNIHSTERILPEYQDLQVGDRVPLAPDGTGLQVAILEAEKTLALHSDTRSGAIGGLPAMRPGDYLAGLWAFHLVEVEPGLTRLVERFKVDWNPGLVNSLAYHIFLEPVSFVMERGMLLGIQQRAESSA